MKRRGVGRYMTGLSGLFAAALGWFFLAPQQVGGDVAYTVITGNSMEPVLHADDLAVVRAADTYAVGDAVAYRSHSLGRIVLHRIVEREGDRYVFKGDNNDFLDSDKPRKEDLLGKLWVSVPRAGVALEQLQQPIGWAFLGVATAAGLGLFGATRRARGRTRRHSGAPAPAPAARPRHVRPAASDLRRVRPRSARGVPRSVLQVVAAAALALVLLGSAAAAFVYMQPTTRVTTNEVGYEQRGTFTYSASVPKSAVYQDGRVTTGEPVFLRLIDQIQLSFAYEFDSLVPHAVSPAGRMFAELSDPLSGWERRIPLPTRATGAGKELVLTSDLDLDAVRSLAERVHKLTGIEATSSSLEIVAAIDAEGTLAGQPLEASFSPSLELQLDELQLKLPVAASEDGNQPATDPLAPSDKETVPVATPAPTRLSLLGAGASIEQLRVAALVVAAAGLVVLILSGGLLLAAREDEPSRIEAKYGSLLVPLTELPPSAATPIDVASIDALARLADQLGQMILHYGSGTSDTYLVPSEGRFYRYLVDRPGGEATGEER